MVVWRQFADIAERVNAVPAGELFANDPELFWRFRPGLERPDATGPLFGILSNRPGAARGPRDPRRQKSEGEIRILFLGDSCTFGEYLSHAESFVQGVEDSLRSGFPRRRGRVHQRRSSGLHALPGLEVPGSGGVRV